MVLSKELVKAGFSEQQARKLVSNQWFLLHYAKASSVKILKIIRRASKVYSVPRKIIKKAILSFPRFASYNHSRVVGQLSKLGKRIRLSPNTVVKRILKNPVLAGYSIKRYIAGLDVGRQLAREGIPQNARMLSKALKSISLSPYVPQTKRLRYSQVQKRIPEKLKEPPLMKKLRKAMTRRR